MPDGAYSSRRHPLVSPQAIAYAATVEGVVLVDGRRLVELMIEHEVGVTSRPLRMPKIDSDYFEE